MQPPMLRVARGPAAIVRVSSMTAMLSCPPHPRLHGTARCNRRLRGAGWSACTVSWLHLHLHLHLHAMLPPMATAPRQLQQGALAAGVKAKAGAKAGAKTRA